MDGTGSTIHVTTQASIGSSGLGTMTVQAGGSFVADNLFNLGNNATGNGQATFTGTGTNLTALNPTVGSLGAGTLTFQNSADGHDRQRRRREDHRRLRSQHYWHAEHPGAAARTSP